MLGYSEANAIYFSAGKKTGFAKIKAGFDKLEQLELSEDQFDSLIEHGQFEGLPRFKYINFFQKLCKETKQCHCAEHKTYNAFKKKIKKLPCTTRFGEFKDYIPSINEIKTQKPFSVFCGTSFLISSVLSMLVMCLPNLFRYKNTDFVFMSLWLGLSILVLFISSYIIQKNYLAQPSALQIFIAQKALKEVLHGNNN
jgi:hypothetical protein